MNRMNFDYKRHISDKMAFVSCFFPIKEGIVRHSVEEYKSRASRLFKSFNTNIKLFVFTSNEGKDILQSSRLNEKKQIILPNSNVIFNTKYQNVFDIPKLSKYKNQYEKVAKIMQKAGYNYSAEIGAIWNSKLIFLQEVIENYSKTSKLFFWIDIGIVKDDEYFHKKMPLEWPSLERIEKIFSFEVEQTNLSNSTIEKVYTKKVLFWGIMRKIIKPTSIENLDIGSYDYFVHAAFFGGPREMMISLLNEYWKIHDYVIVKDQCVLREELILGAYVALNKNYVFMINLEYSHCHNYHTCVGFIAKYNLFKLKIMYTFL